MRSNARFKNGGVARPVRVIDRVTGVVREFESVSACGRALGKGRTHIHGMIAKRTGKRAAWIVEYAESVS